MNEAPKHNNSHYTNDSNITDLFLQFPAMVAIFEGEDLRCSYVNPQFTKLYPGRELIGRTPMQIVPELEAQGHFDMMREVYLTGIPFYGFSHPTVADWNSDGNLSTKFFNFVYSPYTGNGKTLGLIAFGMDVTENVHAQSAAVQRENFIETISKAASIGLWVCNENMDCVFVNETLVSWTGRPLEQHLGKGWTANIIDQDRQHSFSALTESYAQKQPYHREYRITSADNSIKWCLSIGGPWYNPDGSFGGFAGSIIDITERKQEEKRVQSMVEALPLMAWTAKPNGSLEYFNTRWYEYTGQSKTDATGDGWANVMPFDDENNVISRWKYSIAHKVPYEVECRYKRHDGQYRWHIARAEPIKNEQGEVLYWLGTSTDIHDQKVLSDQLERKVRERTHELSSANLALVRSNEELERFASIASHDLKEPLRKIQVYSDLLQHSDSKNPEAAIKKIREASNRMMALIDDLLEFSSLNKSQATLELVDLNVVLNDVKQDLELSLEEKDASIISDHLPVIKGIPYQLTQLFSNIISNGLKYSKSSEAPKITITTRSAFQTEVAQFTALSDQNQYHLISFGDNGIGFRPEDAEKIFTIFQRLHSRDSYAGTGVGLAVCRKVVHNHAGEIYAESKPGEGSCFKVLFPVYR